MQRVLDEKIRSDVVVENDFCERADAVENEIKQLLKRPAAALQSLHLLELPEIDGLRALENIGGNKQVCHVLAKKEQIRALLNFEKLNELRGVLVDLALLHKDRIVCGREADRAESLGTGVRLSVVWTGVRLSVVWTDVRLSVVWTDVRLSVVWTGVRLSVVWTGRRGRRRVDRVETVNRGETDEAVASELSLDVARAVWG